MNLYESGDNASFTVIVTRYQSRIRGTILKRMKQHDVADTLTQDTFIRAFEHLKNPAKRYDHTGNFHNWLQKIAKNICIDEFRKAKRVPFMVRFDQLPTDDGIMKELYQESPEEVQIANDGRQFVRACIKMLSDDQKEVVLMRAYGGMQFKQIAFLTDVSIDTALGRMRHAKRNLGRHIKAIETMPF